MKLSPAARFALVSNRRLFVPRLGRFRLPTWRRAIPVATGVVGAERGEPLPIRALLRAAATGV